MLENLGLSGFTLSGADVGGFVGTPQPDLLTKWIEIATFQPIDRDHTEKGSGDQEPWVGGAEPESIRRRFIEERYRLMPYLYTLAQELSLIHISRFDRAKAESFLAKTTIQHTSKIRQLSKGMVVQLHLALVMSIDARLLVLDEPTLGLDILFRKQFYDSLLNDYFDRSRTIVVTTHQVLSLIHI